MLIRAIGSTLNLRLLSKHYGCFIGSLWAMNPSADCRRLAEVLREQANEIHDAEQKAKYENLIRGFLRLARQYEQDNDRAKATVRRRERLVNFIVVDEGEWA